MAARCTLLARMATASSGCGALLLAAVSRARLCRRAWDWKAPTAKLRVITELQRVDGLAAARVRVIGPDGHPAFAERHQSWLDGQTGAVFTYSSGAVEFEVPAGEYESTSRRRAGSSTCQRGGHATLPPGSSSRCDACPLVPAAWNSHGRLVLGRSSFPSQLRRPGAAGARRARADDARRGPRCRDAALRQPAHAPHRRRLLRMDASRAAADSVRPGGPLALSRAHRAHRHQTAVLALVLGSRLSRVRTRRSIQSRSAAADARAGRRQFVRASGDRARAVCGQGARRASRWSWCRTPCSAMSTRSSSPVSGATSWARRTLGIGCSTSACRSRRQPAPTRWSISSARWRSARRACTSTSPEPLTMERISRCAQGRPKLRHQRPAAAVRRRRRRAG